MKKYINIKTLLIILTIVFIGIGILSCAFSFIQAIPKDESRSLIDNLSNANYSNLTDGFVGLSWSIIGVLLLCLTLYYQRTDFKDSERTNNKQRFETTFFNMLSMLIQIRNSITCKSLDEKQLEGYAYLSNCVSELQSYYTQLLDLNDELKEIENKISANTIINTVELELLKDEVMTLYESFYKINHASLGHYFRYIYHMVEFVLKERSEEHDAEVYLGIIQAQLSDNELSLLFYNCLSRYAQKKDTKEPRFYNNLDKYGFLENVDSDSLLSRNHHVLYPHTRFKFLNTDEKDIRNNYGN